MDQFVFSSTSASSIRLQSLMQNIFQTWKLSIRCQDINTTLNGFLHWVLAIRYHCAIQALQLLKCQHVYSSLKPCLLGYLMLVLLFEDWFTKFCLLFIRLSLWMICWLWLGLGKTCGLWLGIMWLVWFYNTFVLSSFWDLNEKTLPILFLHVYWSISLAVFLCLPSAWCYSIGPDSHIFA